MANLKRFITDRKGTSLVEFALVGPVFIFLLLAIFESATVFLASTLLEGGVREASRFGITGRTDLGSRTDVIRTVIEEHSVGLLDGEEIEVNAAVYPSFDSIGVPEDFDDENGNGRWDVGESYTDGNGNGRYDDGNGVPGVGGPEEIVLYRVNYDWELMVPFLRPLLPPDGTIALQAQIAVRNEPWPEP